MTDYSDDIAKLLFDLESQKEQTKIDIETSKKRSSEFTGFMEAFGTDGEALTEKWEREETEEKEYQEEVARERAEERVRLEEERVAEETRIKKERQRQLKAKKNATASEVRSLKEKWKREDAELKLEQQRRIQEAEYQLQMLREEQKDESEKQADAFGNFLSILTGEAEQVKEKIQDIYEELDEPMPTFDSENTVVSELGAAENLITDSVKAINKLKQDDIQEEISSDLDVAKLSERLDQLQKNLGELNSIGWGQRGMTYGSGEVKLQFLDDVDATSAAVDGQFLQYQASTGKWIGSVTTSGGFDPAGFHYYNDGNLKNIINDSALGNGLFCEADKWSKITSSGGFATNKLPTGLHSGIAGTDAWTGSGSTTFSRIWDPTTSRFYFDELPTDAVVMFRVKVDMIPESNNTLVAARINFFAIRDGSDNPLLESSQLYPTDPEVKYRILLEGDSGGYIAGDYFQAYNFQQTVAPQELNGGAGVEQERTYLFPIYVGDAHSQRGFGVFELNPTSDIVVNDTSIMASLN